MRRIHMKTFACIAFIVLCASGCGRPPYCGNPRTGTPVVPTLVYEGLEPRSVLDVAPRDMPQVVRDRYRLKPDRRFLYAIAEVDCQLSHRPADTLRVAFRDGSWVIHYQSELVGNLPELPDFGDAATLLTAWVENLNRRFPLEFGPAARASDMEFINEKLGEFHAHDVAEALRRMEKHWGRRGLPKEFLALATRGLVLLTVQSLDWVGVADRLRGKALAIAVMTKTLTDIDVTREEALLALEMGFSTHAESLATALSQRDPVRPYVFRATEDLRSLVEGADGDPLGRFLYMLRLSTADDDDALRRWQLQHGFRRSRGLGVFKPELKMGEFSAGNYLLDMATRSAIGELWLATGNGPWSFRMVNSWRRLAARLGLIDGPIGINDALVRAQVGPNEIIPRFEQDLAALDDEYAGPLLDATTYRSYFADHFYSAIYQKAVHALFRLGHVPSAERVLATLEGAPPGIGEQLHRWYGHLVASEAGRGNPEDLVSDVRELDLGEILLDRTLDQLRKHQNADEFVSSAAEFVRRLDTRPSHQSSVASIAAPNLRDLRTAEKYYRGLLRMAEPAYRRTALRVALHDGDYETILRAVSDSAFEAGIREHALDLIVEVDLVSATAIERSALALIEDYPDDWSILQTYVRFLEGQQDYRAVLPVLENWLSRHERQDGFAHINATNAMSRLLYRLGEYDASLSYAERVVNSRQNGAMGRMALVLGAMGRLDSARALADRLVDRRPGSAWGRSVLTEILWRRGDFAEVVPVLRPDGYTVWASDWREHVTRAFLSVFGDRPLAEAEAAFTALLTGGVPPWTARHLPAGLFAAGRADLAFALQSQLPVGNGRYTLRFPIVAYRYLGSQGDRDAALRWLRPKLPNVSKAALGFEIFSEGDDELLWDLITRPDVDRYAESIWLTRAAAYVRAPSPRPAWRRSLAAHYARGGDDDYFLMGRYLMDLVGEETMFSIATTPQRRCEVAYYLGIKAQAEGRYEDAHDWFQVARATGRSQDFEFLWARDVLDAWNDRDRSLTTLAREAQKGR
ncbi:MAG: hypothetical protein O7F70_01035 [Gemmatimonadetes bacterium]|nr:hypothetical protein [Gemmatimonadota bacterium]